MRDIIFPAEWHPQSAIQVTWPHSNTDWKNILKDVTSCYINLSKEIIKREKLLVVCCDAAEVKNYFSEEEQEQLICVELDSNDTWARDHGGISLFIDQKPTVVDFGFNGWGLKFSANHDNLITSKLFEKSVFLPEVDYKSRLNFILEGGSIESDGKGTILTTAQCLLAANRNQPMTRMDIENYFKESLGADRVLWLNHGYLAGDDTDSHVDTLVRFCNEHTVAYVKCDDPDDEHYYELQAMENELKLLVDREGDPYRLIDLPMADATYYNGERLPSTYANFLIINDAVLLPFYGTDKDMIAKDKLQIAFPNREVIGIDCSPLIRQHGSLHCVTMQIPIGFL